MSGLYKTAEGELDTEIYRKFLARWPVLCAGHVMVGQTDTIDEYLRRRSGTPVSRTGP